MSKKTNEEILQQLSCNVTEAAQVLGVGWRTMTKLIEDKTVHSFPSGSRTRVSTASLKAFAAGEEDSKAA